MVGGDRVGEQAENARALDVLHRFWLRGHAVEEGRALDVGGLRFPTVRHADIGGGEALPMLVALEHIGVARLEQLWCYSCAHDLRDLARGRPDILEINRFARIGLVDRVGGNIDVERSGQRVGHHQRRRGEVVRAHIRVDAALEVAVARQHGEGDQVIFVDGLGDRLVQRAGVADTGRAAIADEVEAHRVEIFLQPSFFFRLSLSVRVLMVCISNEGYFFFNVRIIAFFFIIISWDIPECSTSTIRQPRSISLILDLEAISSPAMSFHRSNREAPFDKYSLLPLNGSSLKSFPSISPAFSILSP